MGIYIQRQRQQQQELYPCGKAFDVAWRGHCVGTLALWGVQDQAGGPLLCW